MPDPRTSRGTPGTQQEVRDRVAGTAPSTRLAEVLDTQIRAQIVGVTKIVDKQKKAASSLDNLTKGQDFAWTMFKIVGSKIPGVSRVMENLARMSLAGFLPRDKDTGKIKEGAHVAGKVAAVGGAAGTLALDAIGMVSKAIGMLAQAALGSGIDVIMKAMAITMAKVGVLLAAYVPGIAAAILTIGDIVGGLLNSLMEMSGKDAGDLSNQISGLVEEVVVQFAHLVRAGFDFASFLVRLTGHFVDVSDRALSFGQAVVMMAKAVNSAIIGMLKNPIVATAMGPAAGLARGMAEGSNEKLDRVSDVLSAARDQAQDTRQGLQDMDEVIKRLKGAVGTDDEIRKKFQKNLGMVQREMIRSTSLPSKLMNIADVWKTMQVESQKSEMDAKMLDINRRNNEALTKVAANTDPANQVKAVR